MQRRVEAVFSARDAGLTSTMNGIRDGANQMARELLDQANSTSANARQAIQSYEDEIRAIERRNKMVSQSARLEIDTNRRKRQDALSNQSILSSNQVQEISNARREASQEQVELNENTITQKEKDDRIESLGVRRSEEEKTVKIREIRDSSNLSEDEKIVRVKEILDRKEDDADRDNLIRESLNEDDKIVRVQEIIDRDPNVADTEAIVRVREILDSSVDEDDGERMMRVKEVLESIDPSEYDERVVRLREVADKEDFTERLVAQDIPENISRQLRDLENREVITEDERALRENDISSRRDEKIEEIRGGSITQDEYASWESDIEEKYRQEMSDQKIYEQESKLEVAVLREILDAIRNSSRREIASDEFHEGRDSAVESVRYVNQVGGSVTDTARRLQEEKSEDDKDDKSMTGGAINTVQNVINSPDALTAGGRALEGGAGMMGMMKNPIVVAAMATLAVTAKGRQDAAQRENSASQMAALTGKSVETLMNDEGVGRSDHGEDYRPIDYGVTREEFVSQYMPNAARARGTSKSAEFYAKTDVVIDKGLALDTGTSSQLAKLGRATGDDAASSARMMVAALKESGQLGDDGQDMTKLNEYMRGFIQLSESKLQRFGVSENTGTMGAIKALSGLGGNFDREDYTVETTRRMDEGLRSGSNEAKAMKMTLLRQLNPDKGRFGLEAEYEKGIDSEGFLDAVLNLVKNSGGTEDNQMMLLDSLMGGQMRKSDIQKIVKSNFDASAINEVQEYSDSDLEIEARAKGTNSNIDTENKFLKETMTDVTSAIGAASSEFTEKVLGVLERIASSSDKTARTSKESLSHRKSLDQ